MISGNHIIRTNATRFLGWAHPPTEFSRHGHIGHEAPQRAWQLQFWCLGPLSTHVGPAHVFVVSRLFSLCVLQLFYQRRGRNSLRCVDWSLFCIRVRSLLLFILVDQMPRHRSPNNKTKSSQGNLVTKAMPHDLKRDCPRTVRNRY